MKLQSLFLFILIGLLGNSFSVSASDVLPPKKKKVLMVVTSADRLLNGKSSGYYFPEAVSFYRVLTALDYEVDVASPRGGRAPMYDRYRFTKEEGAYAYFYETSGLGKKLEMTMSLAKVNPEEYGVVYLAGGFSCTIDFPNDRYLQNIVTKVYEANGYISAISHGVSGLVNVELSNGRYMIENQLITSRTMEEDTKLGRLKEDSLMREFPMIVENKIRERKAIYCENDPYEPDVEVSNRIITGQGFTSAMTLAQTVGRLLEGKPVLTFSEFKRTVLEEGFEEAKRRYDKIKVTYPSQEVFSEEEMQLFGIQLGRKQKIPDAIMMFKLAIETYPTSASLHDALADAYLKNGQREQCVATYKKSLELNPQNYLIGNKLKALQ